MERYRLQACHKVGWVIQAPFTSGGGEDGGEFATYTLDPSGYADAAGYAIGDTVSFHLDIVGTATATEEDQVEKSDITLTADATTDVGTQHVYVIVPGTTPRDAP